MIDFYTSNTYFLVSCQKLIFATIFFYTFTTRSFFCQCYQKYLIYIRCREYSRRNVVQLSHFFRSCIGIHWFSWFNPEREYIKRLHETVKIFKIKKFSSLYTEFFLFFSLYYINRKLKQKECIRAWFLNAFNFCTLSTKKYFSSFFCLNCTKSLKSPLVSFFFKNIFNYSRQRYEKIWKRSYRIENSKTNEEKTKISLCWSLKMRAFGLVVRHVALHSLNFK